MSIIQLISASEQLAEMDIEERKEKEKEKEKESKKTQWFAFLFGYQTYQFIIFNIKV